MSFNPRYALLATGCALLVAGGAAAGQTLAPLQPGVATLHVETGPVSTPTYATHGPLSDSDSQALTQVLVAAKAGEASRMREEMAEISDPLARKIALWALVDANPEGMGYAELDGARRDLAGWPHAARRAAATEKVIETGGLGPQGVIAWFAGAQPATPQGAMALASAYQATGQAPLAAELIRKFWRTKAFDADVQQQMLTRFGSLLTADDHAAREDALLYGAQGPAVRELLPLLAPDQRALAEARIALREGSGAEALIATLPANLQNAPGLAFERAQNYARRDETGAALALMPSLPTALPDEDSQARMWKMRQSLVVAALKAGESRGAYNAAANSGVSVGADAAEAEFYAGWLALSRLKDPKLADVHFAKLQAIGTSPITQGRALYWRGRAMEASGDALNAQLFYADAARYQTTFYGQLAAAKTGQTMLVLGKDPEITVADRARFDAREEVRAAKLLAAIGAKDTFKSFVVGLAETMPTASESAQLVDLARNDGDQDLSMKVVRTAAQHGFILPERGYPLRTPPSVAGAPETAFILGIIRQESNFDPHLRSPVGALGMMQLMPGTAQVLARRMGYSFGYDRLEDADYNMQLGSAYLGQLVDRFNGSYVMAAAAYNAGPGRPTEWSSFCGDPRAGWSDPADFIECIPFSETRNYVMRVLEATQVYRARLNGGSAPLTLAADLKRGGYGYPTPAPSLQASGAVPVPTP
ncbi:MAG: lytic transglycosylase domain-containing protein [Caulobacterales bacterium]